MFFRRAFATLFIGLILGAALGVGFAYWRRTHYGTVVTTPSSDTFLSAKCGGGNSPRITVTWPVRLTSAMGGLERSVDGSSWQRVFTAGQTPDTTGYKDTNVVLRKTYRYQVSLRESTTPLTAEVHTDLATCTTP